MKLSTMNRVLAAVLALGMTAALAGCGKHCFQRGYCRIRCYRGNRCVLRHRGDRRGGRVRLRLPG